MSVHYETYSIFWQPVCTVALYGPDQPNLFKGNLLLRTYYKDSEKKNVEQELTQNFMVDTLFYETNKVLRSLHGERSDEARDLVVMRIDELGDPYQIVYNTRAYPSSSGIDNGLALLQDKDTDAKGTAILVKKDEDGNLTWLEEKEARRIIQQLKALR